MRNGKILGWAWGAGFVDGIGQGVQTASQPSVGLGATASLGAGDVMKMGIAEVPPKPPRPSATTTSNAQSSTTPSFLLGRVTK